MPENRVVATDATSAADAEAVSYLCQSIASGKNWYLSVLGAVGLWASPSEEREGRNLVYLIEGEAFDWLALVERLCDSVNGLLPEEEKNALLFHGRPPLRLEGQEVRDLIGERKYKQYLNFFYGVTVEEALLLETQEEIEKERLARGLRMQSGPPDEAYLRIYGSTREELLGMFRKQKSYRQRRSITLSELKEFTYWLFKYRLKHCEKARIASDTKKALEYLKRQWFRKGFCPVMAADIAPEITC